MASTTIAMPWRADRKHVTRVAEHALACLPGVNGAELDVKNPCQLESSSHRMSGTFVGVVGEGRSEADLRGRISSRFAAQTSAATEGNGT